MVAKSPFFQFHGSLFRWLKHHSIRRVLEYEAVMERIDPRPGERILDLGCGDGVYAWEFAAAGADVIAVDPNPKRLKSAVLFNSSPRVAFNRSDALMLPFKDSCFDKVVSLCVLEHIQDHDLLFHEICRVLKMSGTFVFSVDSLSNPRISEEERHRHSRQYDVRCYYDILSLKRRLAETGFRLLDYTYILKSGVALNLFRMSWWFDRLPKPLFLFRALGSVVLGSLGVWALRLLEKSKNNEDFGLTLILSLQK